MIAFTRYLSPHFDRKELSFPPRKPIKVERAGRQHASLPKAIESLGLEIGMLPPLPNQPEGLFVRALVS